MIYWLAPAFNTTRRVSLLSMLNRSLTMLFLSLMRVSGWQMAALPVPHGHAQCAISQTTARQAVAPQMCSYDHLSSEFQVCARHATQHRSSPASLTSAPSPSQRLANQRTGTVFGEPRSLLRQHKADSAWVLLFNAGERNEGVYAQARGLSHAHPRTTQADPQRALGWPRQVHAAGP